MLEDINVAVIGVGNMGRHHARVYAEIEGVNLVAVADRNKHIGQKIARKFNCRYYSDFLKLINSEKIDAATIAVPTSLHKNVAIACIDKQIPILIEKPIAESIQSAQKIINKSKKNNIAVCIGHIERYNPVVQELKKLIKQNRFGRIISINSKRVGLYPPRVSDVDVIIDLAVHDIDVCNFLLEKEPKSIYAQAGKALNSKRIDYGDIFLDYNGVNVLLQVNWITPVKVRELTLTGIKGYAELSYLNQTLRIYKKGHGEDVDIINIEEINLRKEEPLKRELQNFVEFIKTKKGDVVNAEAGLLSLKVALKAINSHEIHRVVKL
ncbi:Gfo/Idh/MocA family oxidoreductase [candidate division WOR-3 bacterium]|nr:Gfo/Idh/MocA family oxidoreductase [candidate division WOR-3 bacterium]